MTQNEILFSPMKFENWMNLVVLKLTFLCENLQNYELIVYE